MKLVEYFECKFKIQELIICNIIKKQYTGCPRHINLDTKYDSV